MIFRPVGKSGFTLLEMLVALALMGILATGLYTSLYIGFNARERAEASIGPVRSAALVMELLRGDIVSALPPTGVLAGGFLGQDDKGADGLADADTLVFYSTIEDAGRAAPGIRKIEFALATNEHGEDGILIRSVTTNLLAPSTPEPAREVLCRNVRSLNIRYFDGTDWLDSWDSGAQDNALPLAIEVQVRIGGSTGASDEEQGYKLARVFLLPCGKIPSDESTQVTSSFR